MNLSITVASLLFHRILAFVQALNVQPYQRLYRNLKCQCQPGFYCLYYNHTTHAGTLPSTGHC